MGNGERGPVSGERERTGREEEERPLRERLLAILEALGGRDVGANEEELWFALDNGLQIRLSGNRDGRSYDRSTNFAISYGDSNAACSPAEVGAIVARIQTLDDTPIDGVRSLFSACAADLVQRLDAQRPGNGEGAEAEEERVEVVAEEPARTHLRNVLVVGGGTAGYFAALALKRHFPALEVTLIESSKIPVIGVGEATTTLLPPFLHLQLGIDIVDLYREVRPTWKMGMKLDWGLPGDYSFFYPFGDANPVEAYAHDGHTGNQSLCTLLMEADRAPIVIGDDGQPVSLLEYMPFGYHLDNQPFVAFLAKCAVRAGIRHVDAEVKEVRRSADGEGLDCVVLDDGREFRGDLFIDATGFRALLIEKSLQVPFVSFASSLFCDGAVVGNVPQNGVIEPYATAQTMDAGWCWRIPVEGEDHRGYVFSSAFLTVDQARDEMQRKNPGLGDTWTVRFRSGRHRDFWKGNVVAVGNAYGFVEPLESTALHMLIMEIRCLLLALEQAPDGDVACDVVNRSVGEHWDHLRWFLSVHYKFNRKKDTEFWRACRESVDVSGLQWMIDHFQSVGPVKEAQISPYAIPDPVFNYHGFITILLGQQVPCPTPQKTWMAKAQWDARVAESRALVKRALTQAQALELLRQRPEWLADLTSPQTKTWIIPREARAETLKVPDFWIKDELHQLTSKNLRRRVGGRAEVPDRPVPYAHLLGSIAPAQTSESGL